MNATNLQVQLFETIKNKLPANASLVDEVAALLNISTDSAYRRIRGEKPITFEEVCLLCTRHQISLDALLAIRAAIIPFLGNFVDPVTFRFENYLTAVEQQVNYMASFRERKMYYLCKDIPIFHHYHFKELAAFKYFFWQKTILQSPEFINRKIALQDYPDAVFDKGRKALATYNKIDSVEIWNIESLNGTLRQVEFFHDIQAFASGEDLLKVYESLEKLFSHLEAQAELGYKYDSQNAERKRLAEFDMYYNEVVIGDNSVLAQLDGTKICFLTHSAINFMMTRDMAFCENMYNHYQNLMRKSTLISTVSERERSAFFKVLRNRIAARKHNLVSSI